MKAYKIWNVYLNGECIDTVYFDHRHNEDCVKRSLIEHDNCDAGISIEEVII